MNFEITNNNHKEKRGYLYQIKNNASEKSDVLLGLINDKALPLVNGKTRLLETGTGDGSAIEALRKGCINQDLEIIGMDKFLMIAKIFKDKTGEDCIAGDIMNIPLKSASISGVNASAIFHEISSYGSLEENGEKLIIGNDAIQRSISEINRVLVPGGSLVYRDVICPKNPEEIKSVNYCKNSWKLFLEWLLPDFLRKFERTFPDIKNDVSWDNRIDGGIQLIASSQIHREIQRHYLMLRDYFRTQMKEQIGLEVLQEEWLDIGNGKKQHTVRAKGLFADTLKKLNIFLDENNETVLNSKVYDDVFDILIESVFSNESLMNEMEEWRKREGYEIYTYKNFEGMIESALDSVEMDSAKSYVLFPQKDSDLKIIPRNYYENYLKTVVDVPEVEGKQAIHFVKQTPAEALNSLFIMHGSRNFQNKISHEAYLRIIEKLENIG